MPLLLKNGLVVAWSMEKADEWRGPCLMHNSSEFHNGDAECSRLPVVAILTDILETSLIQQKYYLSAKACAGILRRAEKRGKQLPLALQQALTQIATPPVDDEKMTKTLYQK